MASRVIDFYLNVQGNAEAKLDRLALSAKQAQGQLHTLPTATGSVTKSLGGLKEAAEKLRLESVSKSLGVIQGALTAAVHPAGAVAIALGATATAAVAGAVALTRIVLATKAWHDELRKAGQAEDLLTPEQIAAVEAMDRGIAALTIEAKRLGVIVGADLAPHVAGLVAGFGDLLRLSEKLAPSMFRVLDQIGPWATLKRNIDDVTASVGLLTRAMEALGAVQASPTFAVDPNRSKFGEAFGGLDIGVAAKGATDAGKAALAAQAAAAKEAAAAAKRSAELSERMAADFEAFSSDFARAEAAQAIAEKATRDAIVASLDGVSTGLATGIAGLKATQGGLIVGLIKSVGGALEFVADLRENVRGMLKSVFSLPMRIGASIDGILTKLIPRFLERLPHLIWSGVLASGAILRGVIEAVPKMIAGFVKGIANAIADIFKFFKGGEDRNVLTGDTGKVLCTSFAKGRFSLFGLFNDDDKADGGAGLFGDDRRKRRGRSRLTGGYIADTGSYLLHAGERVVPPTGASTSAMSAAMRGGGGNITLNLGTVIGMDARELARHLRNALGSLGTGGNLTPRAAT